MSDVVEFIFSDLLEVIVDNRGKTCPITEKGFPLIATNCIKNEGLYPEFINVRYVDHDTYSTWFRGHPKPSDLIFVLKGTPGRVCYTPSPVNFCIAQDMVALRPKKDIVDSKYLLAVLRSKLIQERIESLHVGSLIPHFKKGDFDKLKIPIIQNPEKRQFIGNLYFDLSLKIELNNKINQELETLAQTLFKQWFIDFEFPNENGEPYKSSGGEMVESELGEIPKGWKIRNLNEISNCFDNKRIPLSSMERNLRKGEYPYYGAASLMDYVDDFIFEGVYLLMGEDGSVTDKNGFPVLQYVFGKFWVNNHAHVLQGKIVSTELILCLLKNTNVSDLVTGAVQPKLNQANMNTISMPIPTDINEIVSFENSIKQIFEMVRSNINEINELTQLRDTLLPKLISGELELTETPN